MEVQPPQELSSILSKIGEEYKQRNEVHKAGEELYKYANTILLEHDILSHGELDANGRKIPRQTKLIPIPETSYAVGLHNCIPIVYPPEGVKVGLFGLDDKDRRALIVDLFTMKDKSLGSEEYYKFFFVRDSNDGLIKKTDGLQTVRTILEFIKANLEAGNVESEK